MRSLMKATVVAVVVASTVGCTNKLPPVNAISYDRIQKVESEIKRQVSVYEARANNARSHPETDPARQAADAAGFICGAGLIDFDISSVVLDLTATTDTTASGSLGFSLPITGPVGSVGPSGSVSKEVNDTQELSLPLYPVLNSSYTKVDQSNKPAPIADVLFVLREALILGGTKDGICVYDYKFTDPKTDPGGTYKLALTITDDLKGGVDIKLSVVSLSASYENKSVTGNTLTVSFHQNNLPSKPIVLDESGNPKPGQGGNIGRGEPRQPAHR